MSFLLLWRVAVSVICLFSLVILLRRFKLQRNEWNYKTRDYWYALVMWSVAGIEYGIESILRHSDFSFRIVFMTAAAITTFKGLKQKGRWGGD